MPPAAVFSSGKRAIFVTAHVGNWELGAPAITQSGARLAAIYSKQSNPLADWAIQRCRSVFACEYLPKESGNLTQARESLTKFAERAYRRPARSDEVDALLKLVESEMKSDEKFESAMKGAMQAYIDCFNRKDPEAIAALYADDATVEDPVGSPLKKGKAEVAAFYKMAVATGAKLKLAAPIRASHGNSAAMASIWLSLRVSR